VNWRKAPVTVPPGEIAIVSKLVMVNQLTCPRCSWCSKRRDLRFVLSLLKVVLAKSLNLRVGFKMRKVTFLSDGDDV
jgi:hypothetical protein